MRALCALSALLGVAAAALPGNDGLLTNSQYYNEVHGPYAYQLRGVLVSGNVTLPPDSSAGPVSTIANKGNILNSQVNALGFEQVRVPASFASCSVVTCSGRGAWPSAHISLHGARLLEGDLC
jgi:hypothetical protein